MRDRITGNDKRDLPLTRGKDQRLAWADIHLREVDGEAEFAQRPGAEIVVPHAGATGDEQAIPAFRRVRLNRVDEFIEIIAATVLGHQLCTGISEQGGDERGIGIANLPLGGRQRGVDDFVARRKMEDSRCAAGK